MAATLTETRTHNTVGGGVINRIELAWVAHTDGSGTLTTGAINGTILRVTTNPAANAPTDNYDITLTDADGVDVLAGQGTDLDTANSASFCPGVAFTDGTTTSVVPIVVSGPLTLNLSNAGDSNEGSLVLYVR
jgi:hypothetical protein